MVNRYIIQAQTCSSANLLLSPISICLIATAWPRLQNSQGIYRGSYTLNFYSNTTAACHVCLALVQLPDRMWWRERPGNLCRFDLRHLVHKSTLNLLDTTVACSWFACWPQGQVYVFHFAVVFSACIRQHLLNIDKTPYITNAFFVVQNTSAI